MTAEQIALGRHALGLPNKRRTSYRNHFCAGPGHDDYETWVKMVFEGSARRQHGGELAGGDDVFFLTRRGAELCLLAGEKLSEIDFPKGKP